MRTTRALIASLSLLAAGCGPAEEALEDDNTYDYDVDGKADSWSTTLGEDNLNGLWVARVNGTTLPDDFVIDSWPAVGIRLHAQDRVYDFTRGGTTLTGDAGTLALQANKSGVSDDAIDGALAGSQLHLTRDVTAKPPITVQLPADRPYRKFLSDLLVPAAQRDRESYVVMHSTDVGKWLATCELYKHGSWQRQYMKGATLNDQYQSFRNIVSAVNNQKTSPHAILHNYKFNTTVTANLKDPTKAALALSTFGMYFSTAAGRSVHIPIGTDSMIYFITDRPSRAERIGLVVMSTPTHGPLASTFGRQLLDLGAMAPADDAIYARTMMELLTRSDGHRASALSGTGRSALTDWFAVMAIEDYRGVAFGNPWLNWGSNMTNVQFYGLVTRALARPGQTDAAGKPVAAQVIVGNELRPGDASYADVLNGGNDMQEYPDMGRLKQLATQYLRTYHPAMITAVESAFEGVVPASELGGIGETDIFHFIIAELYDGSGRIANLTGPQADRAIDAVTALLSTLSQESAQLEQFILSQGVTKSNVAAPKSTGF